MRRRALGIIFFAIGIWTSFVRPMQQTRIANKTQQSLPHSLSSSAISQTESKENIQSGLGQARATSAVSNLSDTDSDVSYATSDPISMITNYDPVEYMPPADTDPIALELAEKVIKNSPRINEIVRFLLNNNGQIGNQNCPKQLLLVGPPGTGKTTMGKAISKICDIPFFLYRVGSFATSYKDSGSGNLEKIFKAAAELNRPCIIIIDELERLFERHTNKNDTESGMLTTLWQLLDSYTKKYSIMFIGTANDEIDVPTQVKDRFERRTIQVPLPDAEVRKQIIIDYIEIQQKEINIAVDAEVITRMQELVDATKNYSHRRVENLVQTAFFIACARSVNDHRIIMKDFLDSLALGEKKSVYEYYGKMVRNFSEKWGPTISIIGTGTSILSTGIYIYRIIQENNAPRAIHQASSVVGNKSGTKNEVNKMVQSFLTTKN